ncbi:hypothetical protein K4A87_08000 [Xanthomonas fragariae]|uniref:hypothetical protein n=1 Tax=Xanthomonas fragariae TaxID=48664 RepID=UPI001EDCD1A0|nr:hypothetical protein [Xanthomonas fragariae]UKR53779.1 hypothetical protein K4A87_08000 [Xanthomonas fragariae]
MSLRWSAITAHVGVCQVERIFDLGVYAHTRQGLQKATTWSRRRCHIGDAFLPYSANWAKLSTR